MLERWSFSCVDDIHSDDIYTLNVNGREIGTGEGWGNVVTYTVGLEPESDNVFAIQVNNTIGSGGPTGAGPLIAVILVNYKDGSTDMIYTDPTWEDALFRPPRGVDHARVSMTRNGRPRW